MFILIKDIKQVLLFMKKIEIRFSFFSMSIFFSLCITLLNFYIISLLFPLSKGVISGNFEHIKTEKVLKFIVNNYPDYFSNSIQLFLLLVLWIYVIVIIKNTLQYFTIIGTDYQAKKAIFKLRNLLLDRYLSFSKSFFDHKNTQVMHSVLTKSSNVIEKQFILFKNLVVQSCLFCMFLIVMIKTSVILTIFCILIFPPVNYFTKRNIKKIKLILKASDKSEDSLNNKVSNILNCLPIIKAFVKEEEEKDVFKKISENQINKSFQVKKISGLLPAIEDLGSKTMMLGLAFGMAFIIYKIGRIDPVKASVFLYISQQMIPVMNSFNNFINGLVNSNKEVEDINEVLLNNEEFIIVENGKSFDYLKKGIDIKNLNFKYIQNNSLTISDLTFSIQKDKTIAIVGPTGSGKSTITNLICRFYDVDAGTIFIDDIDIKDINVKDFRKRIALVGQDSLFFNDSIMNNILYSKSTKISDERFYEILKYTMVDEFVQNLPQKYDTIIGEKGSNLSGGQKQRISIARALVSDYDILILDEATGSLDSITESKVIEAIDKFAKNKTKIIISHKFSVIKKADIIIYLKNGKITESGTLMELIDLKGDFYKNWQLQKIS